MKKTDEISSKNKRNNLTSVITSPMKFETMAPPHGTLSVCGYTFKYLVGITPEIMAYGYHC